MADISLQSERFIALYDRVKPALAMSASPGFQRVITYRMEAFLPANVVETLDRVRQQAVAGITIAGEGASHVVLTREELRMLLWALQPA